jgi:transcriptional regulator with XRE-family HTH domain
MDYGRAVRIVRTAFGMSQAELADRLSIGPSQLSLIESGKRSLSPEVLREISTTLQIPPHLMTLLASEREDIERPENAAEISELASSLLRILVSGGPQRRLPIGAKK